MFGAGGDAGTALEVARGCLAQRIDAGVGYVFSLARIGKAAGSLNDMRRSSKIGLADLEVDDLAGFSAAQARSMTSRMPERGISAGMRANGFI